MLFLHTLRPDTLAIRLTAIESSLRPLGNTALFRHKNVLAQNALVGVTLFVASLLSLVYFVVQES